MEGSRQLRPDPPPNKTHSVFHPSAVEPTAAHPYWRAHTHATVIEFERATLQLLQNVLEFSINTILIHGLFSIKNYFPLK
jgi:hypothetical protein